MARETSSTGWATMSETAAAFAFSVVPEGNLLCPFQPSPKSARTQIQHHAVRTPGEWLIMRLRALVAAVSAHLSPGYLRGATPLL